jgi:hypothetical protein
MTQINKNLRHSLATWLSRLLHPFSLVFVILLLIQLLSGQTLLKALLWSLLSFAILVLPALSFITFRIRKGRYQDMGVSLREDRTLLYLIGGLSFIVLLVTIYLLNAPRYLQLSLQSAFLAMLIGAIFNRFINKLSLHTLGVSGSATALFYLSWPLGLVFGLLSLLVAWSRLTLSRHTLPEVVWGWLVGVLSVVVWFSLRS